MTWEKLIENNFRKWKLTTVHPQESMGEIFQDYS